MHPRSFSGCSPKAESDLSTKKEGQMSRTHSFFSFRNLSVHSLTRMTLVGLLLLGCGKNESGIERALEFMEAGMYEQAIIVLNVEIDKNPSNDELHFLVGKCFVNTGSEDQAKTSFDRALTLNGENGYRIGTVYLETATMKLNAGELKRADQLFNRAISLDPSLGPRIASSYFDAGAIMLLDSKLDLAIERFRRGIDANDSIKGNVAKSLLDAGKQQQPIDMLKYFDAAYSFSIDLKEDIVNTLLEEGAKSLEKGDDLIAEALFDSTLEIMKGAELRIGELYFESGKEAKTGELRLNRFQTCRRFTKEFDSSISQAVFAEGSDKLEGSNFGLADELLGFAVECDGSLSESVSTEYFEKGQQLDPNKFLPLFEKSISYSKRHELDIAAECDKHGKIALRNGFPLSLDLLKWAGELDSSRRKGIAQLLFKSAIDYWTGGRHSDFAKFANVAIRLDSAIENELLYLLYSAKYELEKKDSAASVRAGKHLFKLLDLHRGAKECTEAARLLLPIDDVKVTYLSPGESVVVTPRKGKDKSAFFTEEEYSAIQDAYGDKKRLYLHSESNKIYLLSNKGIEAIEWSANKGEWDWRRRAGRIGGPRMWFSVEEPQFVPKLYGNMADYGEGFRAFKHSSGSTIVVWAIRVNQSEHSREAELEKIRNEGWRGVEWLESGYEHRPRTLF